MEAVERPRAKATHDGDCPRSASIWPRAFSGSRGRRRAGTAVLRKALRRAQVLPFFATLPPCLIGMEAYVARRITGPASWPGSAGHLGPRLTGDELHEVARTMRCDGAPVRPGAGTPRRMSKASWPPKQSGTQLADTIRASGQMPRPQQQAGQETAPDQNAKPSELFPLQRWSHPQRGQLR